MDIHTKQNSIQVLRGLLDANQGQFDAGVIAEIETVIAALSASCDCSEHEVMPEDLAARALEIFGTAVRLLTNLSDFMN